MENLEFVRWAGDLLTVFRSDSTAYLLRGKYMPYKSFNSPLFWEYCDIYTPRSSQTVRSYVLNKVKDNIKRC